MNTTLRLEIDRTVQGGGLGLGENWRAVRQLAFKLPLSSQSSCICRMGRKVVRVLRVKFCCFLMINIPITLHHKGNTGYQ